MTDEQITWADREFPDGVALYLYGENVMDRALDKRVQQVFARRDAAKAAEHRAALEREHMAREARRLPKGKENTYCAIFAVVFFCAIMSTAFCINLFVTGRWLP